MMLIIILGTATVVSILASTIENRRQQPKLNGYHATYLPSAFVGAFVGAFLGFGDTPLLVNSPILGTESLTIIGSLALSGIHYMIRSRRMA